MDTENESQSCKKNQKLNLFTFIQIPEAESTTIMHEKKFMYLQVVPPSHGLWHSPMVSHRYLRRRNTRLTVISPNHMWATSWLWTVATRCWAATPTFLGSRQKAVVRPVMRPWSPEISIRSKQLIEIRTQFSIAPASKSLAYINVLKREKYPEQGWQDSRLTMSVSNLGRGYSTSNICS